MQPIDLGLPKDNRILLIDADTIAYTACLSNQEQDFILPKEFYSTNEWDKIINNPDYDEDEGCIITCNIDGAIERAKEKLDKIQELTDIYQVELHFTSGTCFRFDLHPDYKANRKQIKKPKGLKEVKQKLCSIYQGIMHSMLEADEVVVLRKKLNPDNYLLCYIDKDVGNSVEGSHFNYYESSLHDIDMTFVPEVTSKVVKIWPYLQTIVGDTSDNIKGPYRVGIKSIPALFGLGKLKKAEWDKELEIFKAKGYTKNTADYLIAIKYCKDLTTDELWTIVLDTYKSKGLTEEQAILNYNLVNMNCLEEVKPNKDYKYKTHEYGVILK